MFLLSLSFSHSGLSIFHFGLSISSPPQLSDPDISSVAEISPMAITPLGTMISNPPRGIIIIQKRKTERDRNRGGGN
jgi:hypothetical protein